MEKWTFFLAEEEVENPANFKDSLPGVEQVLPRVWLYPGHPAPGGEKRALPYGEHPAYGRVYARPVAMGSGLEGLRSHPLGQRAKEHYRQRFLEHYAQGQLSEADALRAQAQRLGLWEEEPGLLQRAVELQRRVLLRSWGCRPRVYLPRRMTASFPGWDSRIARARSWPRGHVGFWQNPASGVLDAERVA